MSVKIPNIFEKMTALEFRDLCDYTDSLPVNENFRESLKSLYVFLRNPESAFALSEFGENFVSSVYPPLLLPQEPAWRLKPPKSATLIQ